MTNGIEIKETLEHNIAIVQERIAKACQRAGRNLDEITLVAVSKLVDATRIRYAYDLGLRNFGENWVQEAETKIPLVDGKPTWHFIGHLQTNKARRAVELFDIIQSVDSVKVARAISTAASASGKEMPVLLEVNISGEAAKFGFSAENVVTAIEEIVQLPALRVQGLLTIAAIVSKPEEARPYFAKMRQLRDALQSRYPTIDLHHLSMGMTDDFEIAIEEGATIVRIGRAIFGPRPPKA